MSRTLILVSILILVHAAESRAQARPSSPTAQELGEMQKAMETDTILAGFMRRFGHPATLYSGYLESITWADSIWSHDQNTLSILDGIGTTERCELLPVIDWFTAADTLLGEAGVSYLLRTDEATILFDLGLNPSQRHPSPLLSNLIKLGTGVDEIEIIVISHAHGDHTGGARWASRSTFSLSGEQIPLDGRTAYTPIPMSYPNVFPVHSPKPRIIAKGVATTGIISCPMFFGNVEEQALLVNVEGKGVVIISGCGHQTSENLIARCELLTGRTPYGILGGLHLPISEGRNIRRYYQYFITRRLPWNPPSRTDIGEMIAAMKEKGISMVGVSGHDSCDESIEMFRKAFGEAYVDIRVGRRIVLR